MQLPISKELDNLVEATMVPCLKAAGFSRRADDFIRPIEDGLAQVISIQTSDNNSDTHVRWTLNIAVFAPELLAIRGRPIPDIVPAAHDCFLYWRIARLLPKDESPHEFWYELGTDGVREKLGWKLQERYDPMNVASTRQVVRTDLEQILIPHLDSIQNRQEFYHLVKSGMAPMAGPLDWIALELELGLFDQGCRTWKEHLPTFEKVKNYAKARYGIDLQAVK